MIPLFNKGAISFKEASPMEGLNFSLSRTCHSLWERVNRKEDSHSAFFVDGAGDLGRPLVFH